MIWESNMNNEMYLILIVAVLALIAFMLYARFASRSREKSLHHTLQDQAARCGIRNVVGWGRDVTGDGSKAAFLRPRGQGK